MNELEIYSMGLQPPDPLVTPAGTAADRPSADTFRGRSNIVIVTARSREQLITLCPLDANTFPIIAF
jgi:hypothetical protein